MLPLYAFSALCMLCALAAAVLRNREKERARLVAKLLASLLFCLAAFWAAAKRAQPLNPQTALMLMALIMGFMGDILLGLDRFVPPEDRTFLTMMGGVPFFFGHVLYIILLLSEAPLHWPLLLLLPLAPLVFFALQKLHVFELGRHWKMFLTYGLVLGCMMLSTLNLALRGGALGRLMWCPGVLFAISDTTLFLSSFGKQKRRAHAYLVMLPYYAAQTLFALSVMYL
ncbi:MAG: lysoplasmalogenase [Oscillospiraceae bacterium]|jgi:uncharacterized membrane protein YhhN|nr:lysoplasmalogenase [Oscillospiraceae bacterium]